MKLSDIRKRLVADFKESGSSDPKLDASLILEQVLQKNRTWLMIHEDEEIDPDTQLLIFKLGQRRVAGEPLAYILESRDFWSLTLRCTPNTLIPQPDTEILVEEALKVIPRSGARVLDLATGTGAVALAVKKERPLADVTGSDCFVGVVELAAENARLNNLEVAFVLSFWYENISGVFDVITANPPYVAENDPHLEQGDVRFEPRSALVAGDNGLADLQTVIRGAPHYLKDGGWLLVEHGWDQKSAVQEMFFCSEFCNVSTVHDYGGNDRVTLGQFIKE